MTWSRTIVAFVISLAMAFAPVASMAMAKACTMTMSMTAENAGDCPCHKTMPDCGSMPQCRTAAGCASQCAPPTTGVLPKIAGKEILGQGLLNVAVNPHLASLSIRPPAPPPRG